MADDKQEYDAIADAYRESKQLSFREHIESHTLFEVLGDLQNRSVLDLACGEGFYTRKIKTAGATDVLGVDVSGEMIALAETEETRTPLGCRYLHADAGAVDFASAYDIVSAAYLLCYARNAEELLNFCRIAYRALRPGGRFVGFNDNVNENPNRAPSFATYGFEKRCPDPPAEGDKIVYAIRQPDGSVFEITNYHLSPATYEAAFTEAGFQDFRWEGPWLHASQHGVDFWDDFMKHPPLIGFSSRRPG